MITLLVAGAGIVLGVFAFAGACGALYTHDAEKRWPALGRFVRVNKTDLHVIERGEGPPVLMLHGASANAREFLPALAPELESDFRLLMVDRPGYGYSARPRGADRLGVQADLMAALLREERAQPAIIVAHSLGCAVALRMAIDHPELVRGLVLLAPASHPYPGANSWHTRAARPPIAGHLFSAIAAPLFGPALLPGAINATFAPAQAPETYRETVGVDLTLRPAAFRASARDVTSTRREFAAQCEAYADIHIPVIVITADKDRVVSPKIHARALAECLPAAEIITLPGVGHMPHQLRPDIAAAAVRRLAGIGRLEKAG